MHFLIFFLLGVLPSIAWRKEDPRCQDEAPKRLLSQLIEKRGSSIRGARNLQTQVVCVSHFLGWADPFIREKYGKRPLLVKDLNFLSGNNLSLLSPSRFSKKVVVR